AHIDILRPVCDIDSHHTGALTSVGQMRAVRAELERALRAREKSLPEAEGEDAWNFAQTGPNEDLRLRVERQLKFDLAARTMRLDVLTKAIAAWAQGPVTNRKAAPVRRQYSRV